MKIAESIPDFREQARKDRTRLGLDVLYDTDPYKRKNYAGKRNIRNLTSGTKTRG